MSDSLSAQSPPDSAPADVPATTGRSGRPWALIGGIVLVLAIAAGAFFVTRGPSYAFHGGEYDPAQPAPALDLTDQDGNPFSLDDHQDEVLLVYFGYTTCPDLCPLTLTDYQVVKEELGEDADRVRFVMVTFDPERDTEERLKEYMGFFDPDFIGLRGDDTQTEKFKREYGIVVQRVEYPDSATGYLLDHTTLSYVIDPEGRLRLAYPYGMDPALIAEDIRHLLKG